MLIYSTADSKRLHYILDIIFGRILGCDYRLTHREDEYVEESGAKIGYGLSTPSGGITLPSTGLLFETDIRDQKNEIGPVFEWDELPAFYRLNQQTEIPFDLFAAAFYLISRYEEYLPFDADEHGRFPARESMAYRENFLQQPLINLWAQKLLVLIKKRYPGLSANPVSFSVQATFDIDNAWAFLNKGWRNLAGLVKPGPMAFRNYRYQVLRGNQNDPFDQYDRIEQLMKEYGLSPVFFFLLGNKGPHDRNINYQNRALRALIKRIHQNFPTGIHPSYRSGDQPHLLQQEAERLQKIIEEPITRSRQHYLRLRIPETYQKLIQVGIREDYTMGYPDQTGYRASTGTPFPFFNLADNSETELTVIPFQVMDVTLRQYLGFSPEEAIERVKTIITEAAKAGCQFSFLWHNESLSEWQVWEGWSGVLESILEMASEV